MDGSPPRPARRLLRATPVSGRGAPVGGLVPTPARDDRPVPPVVRTAGDALTAAGAVGVLVAGAGPGRGPTASLPPNRAATAAHRRAPRPRAAPPRGGSWSRAALVRATLSAALLALLTGKAHRAERLLAERASDYPDRAAVLPRSVPRPFRRRSGPG